jgi:hypothetical protein
MTLGMTRQLWIIPYIGACACAWPLDVAHYIGMIVCIVATMMLYKYVS